MSRAVERLSIIAAVALALTIAAVLAFGVYGPSVDAQTGNPDAGCVVGNPSPGSDCLGGNTGQAGGGIGCNPDGPRPCGRTSDPNDLLNSYGNVPGCTSVGDAVNHNPHCAQYSQYASPLRH
jgi:hypothetical protein